MLKAGRRGLAEGVRSVVDMLPIDGEVSWNCDIAVPWVWPVYPYKDSTKIKNHREMKTMAVDNCNPKEEILLEQLQRLCAKRSIDGLIDMLSTEGCPPDTECRDIEYICPNCKECWHVWWKSKLNKVRQNDK